ncbi:MAG: EutN/CcmL family microcompartment protein [Acidobacteria bacterium]|nr:EutN/CcmL family microcompartment protein [Acidobacteriota bacterium]
MKLARVIGTIVCTVKNETLQGEKILILKPIDRQGHPVGKAFIALDSIGAGASEEVFYTGGKEASFPYLPLDVPSDRTIVGILDPSNFILPAGSSAHGGHRRRSGEAQAE